jgi:hypothetical protein
VKRKLAVDPTAVRAAARRVRARGEDVASHGADLSSATSGRIGHGALGETVDSLVKRGLHAVADGITGAVRKLHLDTATGLEHGVERTERDDAGASRAFDDLEHDHHDGAGSAHGGGSVAGGSAPAGGGTTAPPPPRKPLAPDAKKWQNKGGTLEEHEDGSITYTTGTGHRTGPGVSVTYDKHGFPDFTDFRDHPSGVSHVTFEDEYAGNRTTDFKQSNDLAAAEAAKNAKAWSTTGQRSPHNYTWHHDQDLHTMHLVQFEIHRTFPHTGGVSLKKLAGGGA